MNCPKNNPNCEICCDPFVDDWDCESESRYQMDKLHEEALRLNFDFDWERLSPEEKEAREQVAYEETCKWEMGFEARQARSHQGFEHVGVEYGTEDWFEEEATQSY